MVEKAGFDRGIPPMSLSRAYHSCLISRHWKSGKAGPDAHAVICGGGIGTDGKPIDSLEVWYFRNFVLNQKEFPWMTLKAKLKEAS